MDITSKPPDGRGHHNNQTGLKYRPHTRQPRPDFSEWLRVNRRGYKMSDEEIQAIKDGQARAKAAGKLSGAQPGNKNNRYSKPQVFKATEPHELIYGAGPLRYKQKNQYFTVNQQPLSKEDAEGYLNGTK